MGARLARDAPAARQPAGTEQLDGWQIGLAVAGVALFTAAAIGYLLLYRRRGSSSRSLSPFAFTLLAEAMVVIAWARNWQISWWEWHVLMLAAFVVIAVIAAQRMA